MDPNIVANYLKRVFRQMKEPLIPEEQFRQLGELDNENEENEENEFMSAKEKNAAIKNIIEQMPVINQRTLKFICVFF